MSERFLKFKNAFHQSMPQMKFPTFPKQMFGKLNDFNRIKWIQLFSSGVIIYSAYFYLKRTSKYSEARLSFSSFFYHFKKLFTRSIANRCRKKETQKNVSLEVKELPEHVKYDNGWFDELDELKTLFTSTSASASASASALGDDALLDPLRETTPRGEIVVYYDAKTKSFNYYSNSKNIPYSTLDAVARKYVCLHRDPSIYIDIRDEVQKGREKLLKKNKDNKLKLERNNNNKDNNNNTNSGMISSAKKSLFAAFKNYKTGRNAPKSLHNYDGKVTVEEFVVIKDNINKFVYKGTLEQYDVDVKSYNNKQQSHFGTIHDDADVELEHDKNDDDNILKLNREKEALSYADFKKKYNQ